MKSFLRSIVPSHAAFSLVEVALAMGIFVFVLVSLLGLLPLALQASRDSLDIATAAQVADAMAVRLQAGKNATPVYFDDLGYETSEPHAVYQASVISDTSLSDTLTRAKITVSRYPSASMPRHFAYLIFDGQ